jgi:hypothetical protein
MVEVNIWGTFSVIGLTHSIKQSLYGLLFDDEKFGPSRGFVEDWERSTSMESLWKRRRESKFGWINKPGSINLIQILYCFDSEKQRYEAIKNGKSGPLDGLDIYLVTILFFDITICIHIESLCTIFRSVACPSRKTEKHQMLEMWGCLQFYAKS